MHLVPLRHTACFRFRSRSFRVPLAPEIRTAHLGFPEARASTSKSVCDIPFTTSGSNLQNRLLLLIRVIGKYTPPWTFSRRAPRYDPQVKRAATCGFGDNQRIARFFMRRISPLICGRASSALWRPRSTLALENGRF